MPPAPRTSARAANIPFGVGIKPPGGNGGGKERLRPRRRRDGRLRTRGHGQVQGAQPGESAKELQARITQAENPDGTAASTLAARARGPAARRASSASC